MSGGYGSFGFKAFLIAFLCIVGIACVVGGITYSLELWGGKTIPDVVGMTQSEAKDALKEKGFDSSTEKMGSDEEKGTVLGTDPEAGTRLEEGSEVTIFVATPKSVPNVCGMMLEEARTTLSENGYDDIEVVEKASDEPQGSVLEQDPKSGSKAKSDSTVTLTVATPHLVPDVKGKFEADAKSEIVNAGYKYFISHEYSNDVEAGTVIETSPAAGEAYESSRTVEIKVAKSRAKELEDAAKRYLESLSKVTINNKSYEVSQVDEVSYDSEGKCAFTITVRPYETHSWFGSEPETRYGNYEQVSGTVSINDKNEIVSTDPSITVI